MIMKLNWSPLHMPEINYPCSYLHSIPTVQDCLSCTRPTCVYDEEMDRHRPVILRAERKR